MNASRIQHNIASMNAYRNYTGNSNRLGSNLEKLSSGYKINRAGDDAAGLAISEKMRAQITGLEVAQKNAKDGISVVQTAEGALTEVHDMLNRMYSLAEQSANGIYGDDERQKLQDEVDALSSEIDRISKATNFNGIALLDGSLAGTKSHVTAMTPATSTTYASMPDSIKDNVLDYATVGAGTAAVTMNLSGTKTDATTAAATVSINISVTTAQTVEYETSISLVGFAAYTNSADTENSVISGATLGTTQDTSNNAAIFAVTVQIGQNQIAFTFNAGADMDANQTNFISGLTTAISTIADGGTATSWVVDASGISFKSDGSGLDDSGKIITFTGVSSTVDETNTSALTTAFSFDDAHSDSFTLTEGRDAGVVLTMGNTQTSWAGVATVAAASVVEAVTTILAGVDAGWTFDASALAFTTDEQALTFAASDAGEVTDAVKELLTDALGEAGTDFEFEDGTDASVDLTLTVGNQTFSVSEAALTSGAVTLTDTADSTNMISIDLKAAVTSIGSSFSEDLGTLTLEEKDSSLVLQIGDDNEDYNQMKVAITAMGSGNLFRDSDGNPVTANTQAKDGNGNTVTRYVDIMSPDKANAAMGTIKSAIERVSVTRGNLGAIQNRLDHTINNLGTTRENLQDAESAIRDTDVAEEMMKYTKNSIMNQAAQAMLAQANQLPQGVLQLLQ